MVRIANTGGTGAVTDSIPDPSGDRLGTKTGSTVAWLTPDLHGSIAAGLAQTPSSVTDAIRYDGYGQTVAVWPSGGSPATASWKYQGRLDLSPSSIPLYAAGARDYAPGLGMFTSLDSFAGSAQDPLSMNRFLYAEANPTTLVDPTGHMVPTEDGGGSGSTTPTICRYGCGPTISATDTVREAASHSVANRTYAATVMAPVGPTLDPTAGMTDAAIACMRATPQYAGYCRAQGYGQGRSMSDGERTLYLIWLVASPVVAAGCVLGGCEAALVALGETSLAYGLGVPIGTAGAATTAAAGTVAASGIAVSAQAAIDNVGGALGSIKGALSDMAGGFGDLLGFGRARAIAAGDEAAGEDLSGIVYLRTDTTGGIKPYYGQTTAERFDVRQYEHQVANPGAVFKYQVVGRAEPGSQLDRLEEYFIRGNGGPGPLSNRRHQMNDLRYVLAGGDPFALPGFTVPWR